MRRFSRSDASAFRRCALPAMIPSIIAACRQLRQSGNDVTNRIQPFFRAVSMLSPNVDKSALHLGFRFLQAATIRHGFAAHGQQQFLRLPASAPFPSLSLNETVTPLGVLFSPTPTAQTGEHLDAFLLKRFSQLHGNLFILHRHNSRQRPPGWSPASPNEL